MVVDTAMTYVTSIALVSAALDGIPPFAQMPNAPPLMWSI
jgi:hypothetical protein